MTVASYLLYAVAVLQLINALIVFSTIGPMREAAEAAYAGTDAEGAEGFIVGVLIAGGVINLIIGIGFAVLSYFNSKGKNPSRIVTWVIGGISLCCLGAGLGSNALVSGLDSGASTTGPSQDEVQRRMEEATPSWYTPTTTALTVIGLLAILGAVILLALPASNDFFRKPAAAGWDPYQQQQPPYPGQPYPGQSYPGQPHPGQSYPGQAYPGQQGQPGQPAPGLPPYPGQQGQPGQPAPGLPPYPGQSSAPPNPFSAPPPGSDPYAPPPSGPPSPPPGNEQPPRPPDQA